jgi:hypothetical protein
VGDWRLLCNCFVGLSARWFFWGNLETLATLATIPTLSSHISWLLIDLAHRNTLLVGLYTPTHFNPIREPQIKLRGFEG